MKGDPDVVAALNELLTHELTAINQYYVHSKMCANWGYKALAKKKMEEAMEEMRHADALIERILLLDGVPNMQRLSPVKVGEDAIEQHRLYLELEMTARERLNRSSTPREGGQRLHAAPSILKEEEDAVGLARGAAHARQGARQGHYLAQQLRSELLG